jgi:hypothetical protein
MGEEDGGSDSLTSMAKSTESVGVDDEQLLEDEERLDGEAGALLDELSSSQADVLRMIEEQKREAQELGGLRDNLAQEVRRLGNVYT